MDTSSQVPAVGGLEGFELWDRTVRAPAVLDGILDR